MRKPLRRALLATMLLTAAAPAIARAQTPPAGELPPAAAQDCSRWPGTAYDEAAAGCVCADGKWWNLRGDACLPKEHAGSEFCTTVWPGSSPLFTSGGGYRCVCAPPLIWNFEATACRPAMTSGEEDCTREWPGTLPVIAPSGTEFECRCPGGRRWDDASRSCVGGAPVIRSRGYFADDYGSAPPPGAVPAPPDAGVPQPRSGPSNGYDPYNAPSDGYIPQQPSGDVVPLQPDSGAGSAPPDQLRGAVPRPSAPADPACERLLSEIRARAQAGQSDQADALGMKAAIAGCDPTAISDAARVPTTR